MAAIRPREHVVVMKPISTTGRLHFLDALRGIAAMSVVFAHYIPNLPSTGFDGWLIRTADLIDPGKFGVVLFFLISGYII
ncbi:MAG: acyltransferase family protein, partial [Janthinobacterium lividum]